MNTIVINKIIFLVLLFYLDYIIFTKFTRFIICLFSHLFSNVIAYCNYLCKGNMNFFTMNYSEININYGLGTNHQKKLANFIFYIYFIFKILLIFHKLNNI